MQGLAPLIAIDLSEWSYIIVLLVRCLSVGMLSHLSELSDNTHQQGWEFAHWFSERIARFLFKNEQMSDSLKNVSDSLIRPFLVSDLSDLLTITHFL